MTPRADQPVKPWRVVRQDAEGVLADPTTGLVSFDVLGRYGDAVATCWGVTVTSETGTAEYLTRKYRWTIERKPAGAGVDLEGLTFGGRAAAWTRVNNCTGQARAIEREARKMAARGRLTRFRYLGMATTWEPLTPPEQQVARVEDFVAASVRRMKPRFRPGVVATIQRQAGREADAYREQCHAAQVERVAARIAADEHRHRLQQVQQAYAAQLLDGTMSPADLTPAEMEMMTA